MENKKAFHNKIYLNTNRLILHSIVPLLTGQCCLLLLFFVALTPLISYVYQLTLRVTGFSHVTVDNLVKFLINPISFLMLLLLFFIIGIYFLLDIYYLTIFFGQLEQNKKPRSFRVLLLAAYKLVLDLLENNIGLIPVAWNMLALFNLPLFLFVSYKTRVMRYIANETPSSVIGITLGILIIGFLYLALFRKAFLFQNHILGHLTCKQAGKCGKLRNRNHTLHVFLYFLGWNIIIVLAIAAIYLFLMGITMLLSSCLFNRQMAIATFIYLIENLKNYFIIFIFLICSIGNLALYTHLFYFYHMESDINEEITERPALSEKIINHPSSFKKLLLTGLLLLIIINLYFFVKILRNGSPLEDINLNKIEVTSHRGFSHDVPENTLPAIEKAIEERADCVELDVRVTKDGVPVVLHDSNLKRITGVNKYIWNVTYRELAGLDAGKWMNERYAGTRIPTLEEVLESCKGRINLNLDLKYYDTNEKLPEKVIELIRKHEMEWQCVISSTSLECLKQIKELNPDIQTGYITYQLYPGLVNNKEVDFFSIKSYLITKNVLHRIHKSGKKLVVWTVDSKTELERLERIGVDNIITDNPAYAKEVLYESEKEGYFLTLLKIIVE